MMRKSQDSANSQPPPKARLVHRGNGGSVEVVNRVEGNLNSFDMRHEVAARGNAGEIGNIGARAKKPGRSQ